MTMNKIKQFSDSIKDFNNQNSNNKVFLGAIMVFAALWTGYVVSFLWEHLVIPYFYQFPRIPYSIAVGIVVIVGFIDQRKNIANIRKTTYTVIQGSTFAYVVVFRINPA